MIREERFQRRERSLRIRTREIFFLLSKSFPRGIFCNVWSNKTRLASSSGTWTKWDTIPIHHWSIVLKYVLVPPNEVHQTNDGKTIRIESREENGTIDKVFSHWHSIISWSSSLSRCLDNKNLSKWKIASFTDCRRKKSERKIFSRLEKPKFCPSEFVEMEQIWQCDEWSIGNEHINNQSWWWNSNAIHSQ